MIELFPNETVFIQWCLFMMALVTLHWGFFKPVLRILHRRRHLTAEVREGALSLEQKSNELENRIGQKMDEVRLMGIRKKGEILKGGEKVAEGMIQKARQEVESRMEAVRLQIESDSRTSTLQLRQHAQDLGREIAVKVLTRDI